MIGCISVIVPCYRQAHYLRDCIASLQQQTYTDWEAIVVDDGSPDDTEQVVQELARQEPRLRYVRKTNGGLSSARNAGIAVARGAALQFLDADDLLQPNKLQQQADVLECHADVDVVYGGARYFRDEAPLELSFGMYARGPDHDWIQENWLAWQSKPPGFVHRNLFPVCSPLLRRSVVARVGLFDCELPALEDWDFWWRCELQSVRFAYCPADQAHALVRMHGTSMTHESPRIKQAYLRLRRKHLHSLPAGPLRDHHLDELLRATIEAAKAGEAGLIWPLLSSMGNARERLQAIVYVGLHHEWIGRRVFHRVCGLLPWRVRQWLDASLGLRAVRTL